MVYEFLQQSDPDIHKVIVNEIARQRDNIGLIGSENIVTRAVLEASGCEMTNKYAEGYPGKRYYGGCEFVDDAETIAQDRAKQLFQMDHINVQPHSGTQANLAVIFTVCEPGDTILSMNLNHGGHLSHGHHMNLVGKYFNIVPYGVEEGSEILDYDKVEAIAKECKPKLIICGASAYSQKIDFERFGKIARAVNAPLLADIAHIAGIVAVGLHPNPAGHADFVTTTTHKTLRGPRGGMIMCKEEFAKPINSMVFPGSQGGPLMHTIAAKAVCFGEALKPTFKTYIENVLSNASALASALQTLGYRIVSGGTENHLFLVDMTDKNMTGKAAENRLNNNAIIVNKNLIPFDPHSAFKTSGLRLGTPIVTSRGMGVEQMQTIADLIHETLSTDKEDEATHKSILEKTIAFASGYPIYPEI